MPKSADGQVNFNGGILSPKIDARIDNPKYKSGLRQCSNMIPYSQGPVTRRPGTQFVAKAKAIGGADYAVRLIKFVFSPATTFVMEFGHHYIRFYSNGVPVLSGGFPVEVVTPYDANATTAGSPWATDIYGISYCQINDVVYLVHNKYAPQKLVRLSDTVWTFTPVVYDLPAVLDENTSNTVLTPSATSGAITMTASAPAWIIATYYITGSSVQNAGIIYTCLVTHTSTGTFAGELASNLWVAVSVFQASQAGSTWQFRTLRNASSTFLNITANATGTSLPVKGNWRVETTEIWSADIAIQRSLDNGVTWATLLTISGRGDTNRTETGAEDNDCLLRVVITNWAALASAIVPRVILTNEEAFIVGTFTVDSIVSATVANCTVVRQLNAAVASVYWSEAAWSGLRGYPRAIAAFQQRVVYAGSTFQPQRFWGTVTNDLENFNRGDPLLSTSSFAFDLAAPGRGPILWLLAQLDLFAGLSGAEWVINSGTTSQGASLGGAITPTTVNAVEHSNWGSAFNVQPHVMGDAVVYCQRQATNIRQMLFSIYTQKYMSQDVTENVDNLLAPGVVQMDYQAQWRGQGNLWAVTQLGNLIGLSYDLDQQIYGWHQHTTGAKIYLPSALQYASGDNGFESVCTIPGKGAADDEVWLVVNRTMDQGSTSARYIERMNPTNWEQLYQRGIASYADSTQAYYVDSGLNFLPFGATATFTLAHLPNRWICGLADGKPFGPLLTDGSGVVTIPNYNATFGFPLAVTIGVPIPYAMQPMRIDMDPRAGSTQGMIKQMSDLFIRVMNSSGGEISNGTVITNRSSNLYEPAIPINYVNASYYFNGPNNFVTDPVDIRVQPQLMVVPGTDPVVVVQGQDALPLTVVGLFYKYSIESTP
jgi:hypothetical protein